MSQQRVTISGTGGVTRVVLDRPDKRNGLDLAMFEGLVAAGETVASDPAVRAVILTGAGSSFCAGLDFKWFMANPTEAERLLARSDRSPANLAQRAAWIWQEVPVPVIAAIRGAAFGGGLQIALGADIRLVAADAALSIMEIEYGLIPDMSITQTLPRLVPIDRAKELAMTGRVVSGEEAVALGLATRVVADPLAEAEALAKTIASKSPHAVRAIKALLDTAPTLEPEDALRLETDLQLQLLGTPNQVEAVAAKLADRPATFADPG